MRIRRVADGWNADAPASYSAPGGKLVLSPVMELLQEPPPGFDAIARAFAMARHLPTSHQLGVQVGLASEDGLFARGQLDGYRQVSYLREQLRELGWREHLLGGDDDMFGCDMLFSQPELQMADAGADPSFIRRTPVELWGEQAGER